MTVSECLKQSFKLYLDEVALMNMLCMILNINFRSMLTDMETIEKCFAGSLTSSRTYM